MRKNNGNPINVVKNKSPGHIRPNEKVIDEKGIKIGKPNSGQGYNIKSVPIWISVPK